MKMHHNFSNKSIARHFYLVRIPVLTGALFVILFYTYAIVVLVPNYPFGARWTPDGQMEVLRPYQDTLAEALLRPGDIIYQIDGRPALRSPWRFLFEWDNDTHIYDIQRGDEQLQLALPNQPMDWTEYRSRTTAGAIAVGIWGIAAVVLAVAPTHNRQAWRLGLVSLATAVTLAASEGALYNIPIAWLISEPFLPLVSVAFAALALMPCPHNRLRWAKRLLRVGYVGTGFLALALLFEILILRPQGLRLPDLGGLPIGDVGLLVTGLGLLLNPVLLIFSLFTLEPGQARRSVQTLLLFTLLAILPLVLFTILPRVLTGTPVLAWELGISMLLLVPIGYGFVVYRRQFLGLDLIVSRTLVALLLILLFTTLYGATFLSIALQQTVQTLQPMSGIVATCIAMGGVVTAGQFIQRQVHSLVFGPSVAYADKIADYTASLASEPEVTFLERTFREVMALLEIQRAFLWIVGEDEPIPVSRQGMHTIPQIEMSDFETVIQRSTHPQQSVFAEYEWLELVIPLRHEDRTIGVVFIGNRVVSDYFNQLELGFLKQISASIAVTVMNIALFEASRMMSRLLLYVREEERVHFATLLHNGPLQRLTLVSGALHRLQEHAVGPEVKARIEQIRNDVLLISSQLRTACTDLHSPVIDLGVELTVQEVIEKAAQHLKVPISLEVTVPPDLSISSAGVTAIYHILTEALNNIHRHAGASAVTVSLAQPDAEHLHLLIRDNGRGFVITHTSLSELLRSRRFGLVGMHEWARLAHGVLAIQSRPGAGTTIDLTIPLFASPIAGSPPSFSHIAERKTLCPT
ncbi:GAF domain-containing protein [bacterium]|nr:GAF domain-containing protein [bacterium]